MEARALAQLAVPRLAAPRPWPGRATIASTRARISSIFSSSLSSYAWTNASCGVMPSGVPSLNISIMRSRMRLVMSVQPSITRSSSANPPVCRVTKFISHSCCQPGCSVANHSGSIGWLLRTSIDDGVRWKTNSSFGVAAERRDALHRSGAGADDADPLVGQVRHRRALVGATGVVVVPPAGVEAVAAERVDAGDARQLRPVQRTGAHRRRTWLVIRSPRSVWIIQPRRRRRPTSGDVDRGGEHRLVVEAEVVAMRFACPKISGASTYFCVGMCPVSSSSGR